jgi:2-succinyl-5-enolpyruvyl-6-hydroxy-3-cyclohexene-1-carboxylate synthase
MDQQNLFGRTVKWSHDIESTAEADPVRVVTLAARLVDEATGAPAGPVHLNIRYREPLMPTAEPPEAPDPPMVIDGRLEPSAEAIADIAATINGTRGIVIAGPQDDPAAVTAAAAFAAAAGWPIIADALSGLRCGPHDRSMVLQSADPLAWGGWLQRSEPEWVIRFGALPTSKPLWSWLEQNRGIPDLFIEPSGWRDPTASAASILRADPAAALEGLAKAVGTRAPAEWIDSWRAADAAATTAITTAIDRAPFPNEPSVARTVGRALTDDSTLWVASSMPVRDVDAFLEPTDRRIRVMANRGVNGIDGFLSVGLGSAAVSGRPTTLLAGDLSVLHDLGALATASRLSIPATIVVVNNDGGGIFHFLPQEGHQHFERHFGTPHGLDFTAVAGSLGVEARLVDDAAVLADAVGSERERPLLLEVRTDRNENVTLHRSIKESVETALRSI